MPNKFKTQLPAFVNKGQSPSVDPGAPHGVGGAMIFDKGSTNASPVKKSPLL